MGLFGKKKSSEEQASEDFEKANAEYYRLGFEKREREIQEAEDLAKD